MEKYLELIYRKKIVGIEKMVDESLLKHKIPASDSLSCLDTRPAMPPIRLRAGGPYVWLKNSIVLLLQKDFLLAGATF